MPFKSAAQRRLFYANPKLRKYIPEFEAATPKGKKLPEHVARAERTVAQKRRTHGRKHA